MYYFIGEPEYKTSTWYKRILDGLHFEKRQKRFSLTELEDSEQLKRLSVSEEDTVFVVGTDNQWLDRITCICGSIFGNRVIVLANHESSFADRTYSIVTADISRGVQLMYRYLQSCGKTRIAMYGINPRSASDSYRKRSFLSCGGCERDLFYNEGSLSRCYDAFARRMHEYDSVICVNGYSAASLIRHLPDHRQFFIVSCGTGSALVDFFHPTVTHTRVKLDLFAKAGLDLSRVLQNNSKVSSVTVYLDCEFVPGETTCGLPLSKELLLEQPNCRDRSHDYYADREVSEMIRAETLLGSCEPEDLHILRGLLAGRTYDMLAEELYMSVNGIKYKVRNMCRLCGAASRTELLELSNQYLSDGNHGNG